MPDWFSDPAHLRLTVFLGVLTVLLLLEKRLPRRQHAMQRSLRWPPNFGLVLAGSLLVMALPLATLSAAVLAQQRGIGLFNTLSWPLWVEVLLCFLAFDLAIYAQHRLMHAWPLLWRLHRVHHSDIEFDATTALRFHPLEILLSVLWKTLLIALIGAPLLAVLIFEITLNAAAMFNHANLRVAGDAWLRRLIVTPDMHRVHHSTHQQETDSNYGFALSCWDHLFGSYRAQPAEGHESMRIGLDQYREIPQQKLVPLLLQPIKAPT